MNLKRKVIFFLLVSFLSGFFAALGSIPGGALFGQNGLFVGAITFGIAGIVLIILVFKKIGWIDSSKTNSSIVFAVIGFLFAAPIAVYGSQYFNNPITPVLSTALVGLGALFGLSKKKPNKNDGK
jgi:hypothetical protein